MGSLNKRIRSAPKAQSAPVHTRDGGDSFKPIRTEDWKPEPGAQYKWLVIEPDIFSGEDIVVVMKPDYLAEAEKENPGLVTYLLSEIDAMKPFEQDHEFRRKIHLAKKYFGGFVRPADPPTVSTL